MLTYVYCLFYLKDYFSLLITQFIYKKECMNVLSPHRDIVSFSLIKSLLVLNTSEL